MPEEPNQIPTGQFGEDALLPDRRLLAVVAVISLAWYIPAVAIALFFVFRWLIDRRRAFLLTAAVAFVAGLIHIFGVYLFGVIFHDSAPNSYSYKALNDYKLDSQLKGTAFSLKKPIEVNVIENRSEQGGSVSWLAHTDKKKGEEYSLTYITVASNQSVLAATPTYLEYLNKSLMSNSGKDYDSVMKSVTSFTRASIISDYKYELSDTKHFTSPNISKNAWQFDLKVTSPEKDGKKKYNDLKGKVILAAGKKTFYYFLVTSLDYNWEPNTKTWQQIYDSLKIDQ